MWLPFGLLNNLVFEGPLAESDSRAYLEEMCSEANYNILPWVLLMENRA